MTEAPAFSIFKRFSWVIPGEPMGWQRPGRFHFMGRRGPMSRTFDTPKNEGQKKTIRDYCWESGWVKSDFHSGPVRFKIVFVKSRPGRLQRKKDPEGLMYCPTKPDWDNCGKMVSDALNAFCYKDDSQICDVRVLKLYSEKTGNPRTEITMELLNAE